MTNEELIRTMITAYGEGNLGAVLEHCADNVDYCVQASPETGPYAITCKGKEAFVDALQQYGNDWEILGFELVDIIVSGDKGACRCDIRFKSRKTGAMLSSQNALFFTIQGNLVTHVHEFHDTATISALRG
jgi:uncharacterized protein